MPISMFYERPTALNREQHSTVKLKPNGLNFSFAAGVNSVPLAGVEFAEAARSYPIFFLEPAEGEAFPIALLGLASGGNRFVTADGAWRDSYVPAFVRRYPFVLADDNTVCFDEAYPGFNRDEGEPLFGDDGKESDFLNQTITFLVQFQEEMRRTQDFTKTLRELNLLKSWGIQSIGAGGEPQILDGLSIVDTRKLTQLADDEVLALFRSGAMAWIHAHLLSLGTIPVLTAPAGKA